MGVLMIGRCADYDKQTFLELRQPIPIRIPTISSRIFLYDSICGRPYIYHGILIDVQERYDAVISNHSCSTGIL